MTVRLRELPADHLFTVQEAADWLRVSRWSVYTLIHANQLRTIKIGRRRLVSREALNECVTQLAKGAA
jgi:excisionase family DNA binding protein